MFFFKPICIICRGLEAFSYSGVHSKPTLKQAGGHEKNMIIHYWITIRRSGRSCYQLHSVTFFWSLPFLSVSVQIVHVEVHFKLANQITATEMSHTM